MQELTLADSGGHSLPPGEIEADDFIAWVGVGNYNPDLLGPDDPYFGDYNRFMDEINKAKVVTLDMDQLSKSKFDDLNFNEGVDNSDSYTNLKPGFAAIVQQMEQEMAARNYMFMLNNQNTPYFSPSCGPSGLDIHKAVEGSDDDIMWSDPVDPAWEYETGPQLVKD